MSFAKIRGRLTSRIGRPVNFSAPQDVSTRGGDGGSGVIIDEVWADSSVNDSPPHDQPCDDHCWGDYSFCAQHIEWADGNRKIRLAYYRRRCGEDFWTFASQMTATSDADTIKKLLESTLGKVDWFCRGD
jgi:hypothetical protein